MSNTRIILRVNNLSKQYKLGLIGAGTLSDDLKRWWYRIRGKKDPFLTVGDVNDRSTTADSDYVWALQDINFDVQDGEVLGIIGKNGAGKSTLLKILSRVTAPTTGEVKTKGRIASLLEVGTGFHPELTGRENIYLNGAILGMNKAEIKSKEQEIIDFSGCERYVDTPVKRYSSGMRVRLAFAVAAHLEPDILVIDEVLAVGDAEFQKKAIGKMQDISKGDGRTVLFVSHNMAAVKSLCTRAIVLEHGKIVFQGGTDEAVSYYLKQGIKGAINFVDLNNFETNSYLKPVSIGVKSKHKDFEDPILVSDDIEIIIEYEKTSNDVTIDTTLQFKNSFGDFIFTASSGLTKVSNKLDVGKIKMKTTIPAYFFNAEDFYLNLLFIENKRNVVLKYDDVLSFVVINEEKEMGTWMGKSVAPLRIKLNWEKEYDV